MQAADFRDALTTLVFERAKRAADARTASLKGVEVVGGVARVVLSHETRLILVKVALASGDAAIAFDESP
jgi:hypothetical protein